MWSARGLRRSRIACAAPKHIQSMERMKRLRAIRSAERAEAKPAELQVPDDAVITVNQRKYAVPQKGDPPVVIVCIAGGSEEYLDAAIATGECPFFKSTRDTTGTCLPAQSCMPSLACNNQVGLATGTWPLLHGITGNMIWREELADQAHAHEPAMMRAETIPAALQECGVTVGIISAKAPMLPVLSKGMKFGTEQDFVSCAVAAETLHEATEEENGITADELLELTHRSATPELYSADLSEFVMQAGTELVAQRDLQVVMLYTSDYTQLVNAPGSKEANDFYVMLDKYLMQLQQSRGAKVVITADYSTTPKHGDDGVTNVVWLEPLLLQYTAKYTQKKSYEVDVVHAPKDRRNPMDALYPTQYQPNPDPASITVDWRIVLPVTDREEQLTGGLSSFASIYCESGDFTWLLANELRQVPGIQQVILRDQAYWHYHLPPQRVGDLLVVAQPDCVLGVSEVEHDMDAFEHPLRGGGSIADQNVPLWCNARLQVPTTRRVHNPDFTSVKEFVKQEVKWNNHDAFDLALNYPLARNRHSEGPAVPVEDEHNKQ